MLGIIGVGLILHEPAEAQSKSCEALFDSYSKTEIVDVLVEVRGTRMTIAGVEKIPERLGKVDDRYINAGTVCHDITLAKVTPTQMEDKLRNKRAARVEKERLISEYQAQIHTRIRILPERLETVNTDSRAAKRREDKGLMTDEDKRLLTDLEEERDRLLADIVRLNAEENWHRQKAKESQERGRRANQDIEDRIQKMQRELLP